MRCARSCYLLILLCCSRVQGAGVPAEPPPLSTPADAVLMAAQDIARVPYSDQPFQRYLWVVSPSDSYARTWKLHLNLLSRYSEMVGFVEIQPWLWRVDVRDPQWDANVWENAAKSDPFFHVRVKLKEDTVFRRYKPGPSRFRSRASFLQRAKAGEQVTLSGPLLPVEAVNALRKATSSESPVLMAEWLFVQSATQRNLRNEDDSGIGYFDWLQVKDRADYFRLISFRIKESQLFGREFQAALEFSRISPQNRQIVRYLSIGGGVWATLDTDKQVNRGVALRNLKRKGKGAFKHNTEEWYGPLSNGLPATFLSDDKGNRQNVAPGDTHGLHDTSPANESNNKALQNNLGCMNCHAGQVLQPFRDDIRQQFAAVTDPKTGKKVPGYLLSGAINKKDEVEFRKLYLSDIYFWLAEDRRHYHRAFAAATILDLSDPLDKGLTAAAAAKAYSRAYYRYAIDPVTLSSSARELGVTRELWLSALRRYAKPLDLPTLADIPLSRFLAEEPLTISRLTWEDSFPLAQEILAVEIKARLEAKKR